MEAPIIKFHGNPSGGYRRG